MFAYSVGTDALIRSPAKGGKIQFPHEQFTSEFFLDIAIWAHIIEMIV
jgi:hypothetical protein